MLFVYGISLLLWRFPTLFAAFAVLAEYGGRERSMEVLVDEGGDPFIDGKDVPTKTRWKERA
jgi:hypothetical protein